MKIKHKVVKEFQYLSPDKKIFILKIGVILEDCIYKVKTELIPIDRAIIDNNPEFFEVIDWKSELMTFMKINKMPQPAQLGKKLIPFFEDMIMSSIQQSSTGPVMDESLMKELERKESDLNSRERRIKDKEDEIEVRLKRTEKREDEYKLDLKVIEKKDDDLRVRTRTITEKELDIQDKTQDLNERERNLSRTALSSAKEYDSKYAELQSKIDTDLSDLSKREKELEVGFKKVKELESKLESKMSEIIESNKSKIYSDLESELKGIESEVRNIATIAKSLLDFNHPVIIQVGGELTRAIQKLKERVDNNMIN